MIITRTPLRISLLGGNTDFRQYYCKYGGLVLTATIDKYIYCIVQKRFDHLIIVNYSVKEVVEKVSDLKHELVREALKLLNIKQGIEISFLADIPTQGTGLGSSSAVTVGILNALHNYLGESVNPFKLAEEAILIELDILKRPIGVQDQYAVAVGGLKAFILQKDSYVRGWNIDILDSVKEDFNNSLMLFYTGINRKSEDILAEFNIEANKAFLDQNKGLAADGAAALEKGNLGKFGELLHKYWELKKQLNSKVSTTEIDKMYQKALNAGAIGGKVIGAGGGGFLLVMFPANKRAIIRKALSTYRELPFRFVNDNSRVLLNI